MLANKSVSELMPYPVKVRYYRSVPLGSIADSIYKSVTIHTAEFQTAFRNPAPIFTNDVCSGDIRSGNVW